MTDLETLAFALWYQDWILDYDDDPGHSVTRRAGLTVEHGELVEKSFVDTLTSEESQRLVGMRQQLDDLDTIDALVAEVERLRAGLAQYADKRNWSLDVNGHFFDSWFGPGQGYDLARSLLTCEESPALQGETDKKN